MLEDESDFELDNTFMNITYLEQHPKINATKDEDSMRFGHIMGYFQDQQRAATQLAFNMRSTITDPTPIDFNVPNLVTEHLNDYVYGGEFVNVVPMKRDYMERRMEKRRHHLMRQCSHMLTNEKNDVPPPNPWEYVINHDYHLVWCPVFKAASSSWIFNFNILAG